MTAAVFGLWFGSTAFRSKAAKSHLAGNTELDPAPPGPSKTAPRIEYPDIDAPIRRPADLFEPAPVIQTNRDPKERSSGLRPGDILARREHLLVDVDMHRVLANPCFSGLQSFFHDRLVEPTLHRFALQLADLERLTGSFTYSSDLDWYSDPILRFFVHYQRYLHSPLCLVVRTEAARQTILKRLYQLGPLSAASILGRRVFYSPTGLVTILPSPGYQVTCKGGDITEYLRRWPRKSDWPKQAPLPDHLLLTATMTAGTTKERTLARLTIRDDDGRLGVQITLTGKKHRLWRARLRRALRTLVQSAWGKRTGLSWQVDAARWRISPDESTVRFSLERTCSRLRGYLQAVFH